MKFFKGLVLSLGVTVLALALLGTAWSYVGLKTVHDRNTVKNWIGTSNIFDAIADSALNNVAEGGKEQGQDIPTDNTEVRQIVRQVFSDDFLKKNSDTVLDGFYAWLEGKTAGPEFSVDLSGAKQELATKLGAYATTKASSLPTCTPDQITPDFDVFNAVCLPPGVNPQDAGQQITTELLSAEGFLEDPTFNGNDIKVEQNGQDVPIAQTEQAVQIRRAYKVYSYLPIVFGVIAALAAAVILFLSPTKRQGIKRIGITTLTSGLLLTISYVFIGVVANRVANINFASDDPGEKSGWIDSVFESDALKNLVKVVADDVRSALLWYVLGFVFGGITLIVIAIIMGRKPKKDTSEKEHHTPPPMPTNDKPADPLPATEKPTEVPTTAPTVPAHRTQAHTKNPPRKIQL